MKKTLLSVALLLVLLANSFITVNAHDNNPELQPLAGQYNVVVETQNLGNDTWIFKYAITNLNQVGVWSGVPDITDNMPPDYMNHIDFTGLSNFFVKIPHGATISNVSLPTSYGVAHGINPAYIHEWHLQGPWQENINDIYDWIMIYPYGFAEIYPMGETLNFSFQISEVAVGTNEGRISTYYPDHMARYGNDQTKLYDCYSFQMTSPVLIPKIVQGFDITRSMDNGNNVGFGSFVSGAGFETIRQTLNPAKYTLESGITTVTAEALQDVDIFVIGPLKTPLSLGEVAILESFIAHGGSVLEARNWPSSYFGVEDTGYFSGCGQVTFINNNTTYPDVLELSSNVGTPIAVGAHSDLTAGEGIPFLADNDGSGRFAGVLIPPATGRTGRSIIIGDEEIFMTGFAAGTGASYGGEPRNQQLFLNIMNYLAEAPGLDPNWMRSTVTDIQTIVEDFNLPTGTQNSLQSKLASVIDSLNLNLQIQAKNQLNAFINQVNALREKKITSEQADYLIAAARQIFSDK